MAISAGPIRSRAGRTRYLFVPPDRLPKPDQQVKPERWFSEAMMRADASSTSSLFRHAVRITNYMNPFDGILKRSNAKHIGVRTRGCRVGLPPDAPDKCVDVESTAISRPWTRTPRPIPGPSTTPGISAIRSSPRICARPCMAMLTAAGSGRERPARTAGLISRRSDPAGDVSGPARRRVR